jgi:hypothetical protein
VSARPQSPAQAKALSRSYQPVSERPRATARDPFSVDPNELDRATLAHRRTQNQLARLASAAGATVLSPGPGDPDFDLAWEQGGTVTIAEIKSLKPRNEARQLRLALGEILDYQDQLAQAGQPVRAAVVVDKKVSSDRWAELFARHDVRLSSIEQAADLFDRTP